MVLFQLGDFTLHSGGKSKWKIECDALTNDDWEALALMAKEILPPFRLVIEASRGGLKFAEVLRKYSTDTERILIADDVFTTGRSIEELMFRVSKEYEIPTTSISVVVVFSRSRCPWWFTPLFQFNPRR